MPESSRLSSASRSTSRSSSGPTESSTESRGKRVTSASMIDNGSPINFSTSGGGGERRLSGMDHQPLARRGGEAKHALSLGLDGGDGGVAARRIVVEEHELPNVRRSRHARGFDPGRVAPAALAGGVF